jgi:hypothetical protein
MAKAYAVLHPYPTVSTGRLQLDFDRRVLPDSAQLTTGRNLDVYNVEGPFELSFELSLQRERAKKDLKLGKEDDLVKRVRLVVTAVGKAARIRKWLQDVEIKDSDSLPTFHVPFDPNDYRGRLEISAFLIYSSGEYEGRRCGESEPVVLQFDQYDSVPGSDIEWRWVDFSDPANNLTQHSEQTCCLKAETDPPILYLNESIDQFYGIMTTGARKGARARIRDGVSYQIASQVWQALLASTLAKLVDPSLKDLSSAELIGQLPTWQGRLIASFAHEPWPLDESTVQLDATIRRLTDGHDLDQMMIRETVDHVQELLRGKEPLAGFVTEFLEVS